VFVAREVREQPLQTATGRTTRRRRLQALIGRHPVISSAVGGVGVLFVVFVLVWFQPQKLFLDQKVNEALPGVIGSPAAPTGAPGASAAPSAAPSPSQSLKASELTVLAGGTFRTLEHGTSGKALVLRRSDGSLFLRFDDLNTSNGPDLHVYLSQIPASDDWHAYGERYVDLGKLKGNVGDQNYALPAGIDLSKYRSAVVWCQRFAVGFGVAGLPELASMG
jgi:Electron transfer DM13